MEKPNKRLLIVGLGLTGALTAQMVKKERKHTEVVIWEKTMDIGGRMLVKRNPQNPSVIANLGVQFLQISPEDIRTHAQFYEELVEAGLLEPFFKKIEGFSYPTEGIHHFVAPQGMAAIVAYYIRKEVVTAYMKHEVLNISLEESSQQWRVQAQNGSEDIFDTVVFTIPVPQLLKIKGFCQDYLKNVNAKTKTIVEGLKQVEYLPQFSLALFFQHTLRQIPWPARFFPDQNISLVTKNNMLATPPTLEPSETGMSHLRQQNNKPHSVLVAHSTEEFALENARSPLEAVEEVLMKNLYSLVPDLPLPEHTICNFWPYTRVQRPFPLCPGHVVLNENPLLVLGGDSFTQSDFNGCIDSAVSMVELMLKRL